jgi:integrase
MSAPQPRRKRRHKPKKPYVSFPLTSHNNGQWCKKIRGKIHFFGVWEDPEAAHRRYLEVAAELHAGRTPHQTVSADGCTVKDACNHYLTFQVHKLESGEITARSFEDYRNAVESFARFVGHSRAVRDLSPDDFQQYRQKLTRSGVPAKGRGLGVYALTRTITIIRSLFKYAYEMDILDRPFKFGKAFERPSAKLRRKSRNTAEMANGKRLYDAGAIRAMLKASDVPLRAMILLGINGGFGNADCAMLPIKAIDFDRAIIEFNRPKTGIERVVPLWPETLEALRKSIAKRPQPVDEEARNLVFVTTFGRPWIRGKIHLRDNNSIKKIVPFDGVNQEFDKILTKLNLNRKGISFYALRHTFRTWADESRDQHAIHRIMGHIIPGMSGVYVEEISLDRLRAVVNHVRAKLFPCAAIG